MSKQIKLILLTGFLGAGKTTLLSNMLTSTTLADKKVAVLVNDFGALPIDAALLPDGDYYISKVNKGSIFCVCTSADMIARLEHISAEIAPEYLLIEASGMAEPSDVTSMLRTERLREVYTDGIAVCLFDAVNGPKLLQIMPAISAQITVADVIVNNKTDLIDPPEIERIHQLLSSINNLAEITDTSYAKLETAGILQKIHPWVEEDITVYKKRLQLEAPEEIVDYELQDNIIFKRSDFYRLLEKYRHYIIRAKGIVCLENDHKFIDIVNGNLKVCELNFTVKERQFHNEITFICRSNIDIEQFATDLTESRLADN
jgi:G3E family GTPase